jgi:Dyp-type peroxidase family
MTSTRLPRRTLASTAARPSARGGVDVTDIQGLVGSGYGRLPEALFLGVSYDTGEAGRALLADMLPQVTSMAGHTTSSAVNVALTYPALDRLGVLQTALRMFSLEFTTGMVTPSRSAFLGDEGEHAPSTWSWGGPANPRVDVLLLLYADTPTTLASLAASVRGAVSAHGAAEAIALPTTTLTPRNHLGFADGISQPAVAGLHRTNGGARSHESTPGDVALGEFLLGYPNAYGKLTSRPLLPAAADPGNLLPAALDASGSVDLGRNGTYLVVRSLTQDVTVFWDYARRWAARTGLSPEHVAAKMVGRWPSGTSLTVSPEQDDPERANDNTFRYQDPDPIGLGCPIAAHVRRANPRDFLDPHPGSDASLQVANRHRLIRRGREYGPQSATGPSANDERGLHFLCLNASIGRQFEFVQHTWLNNPAFAGLQGSPDPIVGPRAPAADLFSCPALPVRHRLLELPTFTRVRGGSYLFLPGIRALRYLATGSAGAPSRRARAGEAAPVHHGSVPSPPTREDS